MDRGEKRNRQNVRDRNKREWLRVKLPKDCKREKEREKERNKEREKNDKGVNEGK